MRMCRASALCMLLLHLETAAFVVQPQAASLSLLHAQKMDDEATARQTLDRISAHLNKLQNKPVMNVDDPPDPLGAERERIYRDYLQQSANSLKNALEQRELSTKGRKPDLAMRLAEDDIMEKYGDTSFKASEEEEFLEVKQQIADQSELPAVKTIVKQFAGLRLSEVAGLALGRAGFHSPTTIQAIAIPDLVRGESLIIHAETGSGKSLAFLLPITEQLWSDPQSEGFAVILTPTRELAAQVAGVASELAPPGTVRFVARPTNLMRENSREKSNLNDNSEGSSPRLFIGSAKAIMHSLYGDGKVPAPPTSKPEAKAFLTNVRWLVMDEVDRLLDVVKRSKGEEKKQHEKPAAIVCAAVARFTLGRAQIIAASATVGRPLKRELARVLGLPAHDSPRVVRSGEDIQEPVEEGVHLGRLVTIPDTVKNYVVSADESTPGALLTTAYKVIRGLGAKPRRMLLVLTRGFGMNTKNVIGALKHFNCVPEPQSLLDALEAHETDIMIQKHREVSGATGVGETAYFSSKAERDIDQSYLLVTGEDTVRGLHLDGLDTVLVVGRANGPDEYTHIAGRTGRAGKSGKVINIVGAEQCPAIASWQRMLDVEFSNLDVGEIGNLD